MHSTSRHGIRRRSLAAPIAAVAMLVLIAAGCAGKSNDSGPTPASNNMQREPVSFAGTNPFSPPVGADRPGVTRPANAGGTVAASTAGLFGGTERVATCNPQAMVSFLQAHPDKGAAWAAVLGITPAQIPTFVGGLTSVVLRTDTAVTNHGFVSGHATTIPAVLQAGTAVLIDKNGRPVTKCFCGNPLTAPTSFQQITFVGTAWPSFSSTTITIIQPTVTVINQFTLVEPVVGTPFNRPAGTNGTADGAATATPVLPPPSPGQAPAPAPSNVVPSNVVPSNAVPTGPAPVAPPAATAPAPTAPAIPPPTVTAPPTAAPPTVASTAPTAPLTAPPTVTAPSTASAPVVPPPITPSASATPSAPGTATPTPTPTTSPAPVTLSRVVGGCFTDRTSDPVTLRGTVLLRNNDPTSPHSYSLIVQFGPSGSFGQAIVSVPSVNPGQTKQVTVSLPATVPVPAGPLPCAIVSIVNESDQTPGEGPALPAPPDVTPQPTAVQPSTAPTSLTPSDLTPSAVTPSGLTPSDVTPSAVTPSGLTPSDVTPGVLTPTVLRPSIDTSGPATGATTVEPTITG